MMENVRTAPVSQHWTVIILAWWTEECERSSPHARLPPSISICKSKHPPFNPPINIMSPFHLFHHLPHGPAQQQPRRRPHLSIIPHHQWRGSCNGYSTPSRACRCHPLPPPTSSTQKIHHRRRPLTPRCWTITHQPIHQPTELFVLISRIMVPLVEETTSICQLYNTTTNRIFKGEELILGEYNFLKHYWNVILGR